MIKKLKRTLIIVGIFVLMMGIGTNIQVKADTLPIPSSEPAIWM